MGSKGNPATLVDPIYLSICNRDKAFCDLIKLIPKDVYYHTTTADGLAAGVEDEDEISNRFAHISMHSLHDLTSIPIFPSSFYAYIIQIL